MLIKIVHLYIIQLYDSKLPMKLIAKEIGNGYRNMQIVMFEGEYLIVACLLSACSLVTFVNEQNVIVRIIIHVITVLFVLH
jgi:hypothetical protein